MDNSQFTMNTSKFSFRSGLARNVFHIITLSQFLILLTGCGVYKNYERPADITTDGIYGSAQSGDSLGMGDLTWRQVFTDPQLQALIEKTLAQNSNMRQADLRIQEAQNNLKAAKLAFLPSLAISPQGTISGMWDPQDRPAYRNVMGGGATKSYSVPLALNWQIDCFGQLRNRDSGTVLSVPTAALDTRQ